MNERLKELPFLTSMRDLDFATHACKDALHWHHIIPYVAVTCVLAEGDISDPHTHTCTHECKRVN